LVKNPSGTGKKFIEVDREKVSLDEGKAGFARARRRFRSFITRG